MLLGWNMVGFVRFTHISALFYIFKCHCSFKTVCIFDPTSVSVVYWCFLPLSGCEEGLQSFIFLSSGNHPAVLYGNTTSTPAVVPAGPVWASGGRQRGLALQRGQSRDGRLGTILSRRHGGDQPVCRQSPGFPAGRGVWWVYRETATSPRDANGRSDRNYISATGNDRASSCLTETLAFSGAPCCLNGLLSRKLTLCVDDPRRSRMLRFLGECIICFSLLLFVFYKWLCVWKKVESHPPWMCKKKKKKTSKNVQRDCGIFWRNLIERGKPLLTS